MRIRIDALDEQATAAILAAITSQEGAQALPPGVEVVVHRTDDEPSSAKSAGLPEALQVLLALGSGVASNLVSNWLYDLLKHCRATLEIDGKRVAIDPPSIQSAVEHASETSDSQ